MHAQQLPGGGAVPTLPMAMPHPGLAGGPSQLAALTNSNNNGPTPGAQQQLAMLTKQELMLHSRPEDVKGPLGSNEDGRHVSWRRVPSQVLINEKVTPTAKLNVAR